MGTPSPQFKNAGRAFRPSPIDHSLTREQLVAGLRCVFQRTQVELALTNEGREAKLYTVAVACVLNDVADQFGLSAGEREEVLGQWTKLIELEDR